MDVIVDHILRALFLFSVAFTVGTLLLIAFVRTCVHLGLITEKETGNGLHDFLKSFS